MKTIRIESNNYHYRAHQITLNNLDKDQRVICKKNLIKFC